MYLLLAGCNKDSNKAMDIRVTEVVTEVVTCCFPQGYDKAMDIRVTDVVSIHVRAQLLRLGTWKRFSPGTMAPRIRPIYQMNLDLPRGMDSAERPSMDRNVRPASTLGHFRCLQGKSCLAGEIPSPIPPSNCC